MCYLCNKQFLGASPQTSWAGALLLDPAGGTAPDLLFPPMSATFSTDLGCLDKSLANQLYTDIVIKIQNNHDKIHKSIPKLTIQEAQLPQRNSASAAHMEGAKPSSQLPLPRLATPMHTVESETHNKRTGMVPHFKLNRTFKVTQGYPYLCRQEPRAVYCRNAQLMPPLFLKLTKIWQQEHSKFVDFNDPTQVWRRPSKKRLWISTNNLYCQKLESLAYIFAADSVGLHSLVFT